MAAGEGQTQLTGRAAYIAHGPVAREIELLGEHLAGLR